MLSLTYDLILSLFSLLQLQRPRERLCLFVLPVIPPSSSYNDLSCLPVATVRPASPPPSYCNPNTCLDFHVKAPTCVQNPLTPLAVASFLNYLCCFWDFYCNMLNISFKELDLYKSTRPATEHYGCKISVPCPFAEQRERGRRCRVHRS